MTDYRLARRALRLFGKNRHNCKQWLRAVAYLRQRNLWILEGGKPRSGYFKEAA